MEYNYYKTLLTDSQQQLYQEIYRGLCEMTDHFMLHSDIRSVHKVMKAIMLDKPEIYWFQGKWNAWKIDGMLKVLPVYVFKPSELKILTLHLNHALDNLLKQLPKEPIAAIRWLYDWLLHHVRYGLSESDQSIKGVLLDRTAVCKGISRTFQLCMNHIGVPTLLIEGTLDGKARHAWNIVIIKGKPYHVDVTLGYQNFSGLFSSLKRNIRYPCFMISDHRLSQTHHRTTPLPISCNDDMDIARIILDTTPIPSKFYRYGRLSYLDVGTTACVFSVKAEHRRYALKVTEACGDTARFEQACGECRTLSILSGSGVVTPLLDSTVNIDKKCVYLLMPYLPTLQTQRKAGQLNTLNAILKMGIDILHALQQLKGEGYFHVDIQPKNIYFKEDNTAILGDLGCCFRGNELSNLPKRIGTISFMAPEVYNDGVYSESSILYSVGIIMYCLLNDAKLPFEHEHNHPTALKLRLGGVPLPRLSTCDCALQTCVCRMCEYKPELRYTSFLETLTALRNLHMSIESQKQLV